MIYNYITIKDMNNNELSFYPEQIENIKITSEVITIEYWEDLKALKTSKTYLLQRANYYYPHWDGFINTLRIIFDVK